MSWIQRIAERSERPAPISRDEEARPPATPHTRVLTRSGLSHRSRAAPPTPPPRAAIKPLVSSGESSSSYNAALGHSHTVNAEPPARPTIRAQQDAPLTSLYASTSSRSAPFPLSQPILFFPEISRWDFYPQIIKTGTPESVWDPRRDGNCGYHILARVMKMTVLELRLAYWDFLDKRVKQIWPDVSLAVIQQAKCRVFYDGIRGNLSWDEHCVSKELYLDCMDLCFLAEMLQRTIVTFDSRDPTKACTWPPVTGDEASLQEEPIALWHLAEQEHWQLVYLKEGVPLPAVCLASWGPMETRFLEASYHALLHAKYRFVAWRVGKAEEVGCGCRGVAPAPPQAL
ncbi:hypothetical protein BDZ90DRAFT_232537 [Jaminaea rosea]|uniref:OTU domain-containing protein n=1 Tax=Jaminaea rosea TaxID=1569628 RepID=A0A316US17_9BASI|nr:hypothetical protein BDZ90DRAFT_232537 [Jaminaea rosea]PWN27568.1 hypothetical protein BDZ90DRAFT_232537 [Jaminaea rosea]